MTKRRLACCAMLALVSACQSDLDVEQAVIQWLEWPAEVQVATPFDARAILIPPVCFPHTFAPRVTTDDSAVTLATYFLVNRAVDPVCPPTAASVSPLPNITLDAAVPVPGLAAPGTFEMRGAIPGDPAANTTPGFVPLRIFGEVSVRTANPDASRRNAGGFVLLRIDEHACARIQPARQFNPGLEYVLEDQADTTGLNSAFVRGYIYDAPVPVCGQTRVFHLLWTN